MVTPDFAVGLWTSEWSSSIRLETTIQDLARYLPVKISNNILINKFSFS
jgi:hypothetical protein